nr:hypothetical protein [Acinetobacter sp. Marseille-Q1620]
MVDRNTIQESSITLLPIFALSVISLCFFYASYVVYAKISANTLGQKISTYGERLNHSYYFQYKKKIFLEIKGRFYRVDQATIKNFHTFNTAYSSKQIAYDHKNIYCGTTAIPLQTTNTPYMLSKNHVTDGKITIFCEDNLALDPLHRKNNFINLFLPFLAKKESKYYFPFHIINDSTDTLED